MKKKNEISGQIKAMLDTADPLLYFQPIELKYKSQSDLQSNSSSEQLTTKDKVIAIGFIVLLLLFIYLSIVYC